MGFNPSQGQTPSSGFYGSKTTTMTPEKAAVAQAAAGFPSVGQQLLGTPPSMGGSGGGGAAPPLPGGQAFRPPPPEAPLAGPGYGEDWYKNYGDDLMKGKSASEDLYSRGVEASNPFYDYAQTQATKAINDASAARGNFNSSYTMKNIGNAVADLRGQQAKGLTDLANQADQGRFGRYDRGSVYAGRAQDQLEGRAKGSIDAYGGLARDRANLVDNFYGKAGDQMSQANLAAIEAQLKASGMDAAEVKAYMDFITKGADAVIPG